MAHRFALIAFMVATAEAGKKSCEEYCTISMCGTSEKCGRCQSKRICGTSISGPSDRMYPHPMCSSAINNEVLKCAPFCGCDSPVCMPWCAQMQCSADKENPNKDMLNNPSCTGCHELGVDCESAKPKRPAPPPPPPRGKVRRAIPPAPPAAPTPGAPPVCELDHLYAEHEKLAAAVARVDTTNKMLAKALEEPGTFDYQAIAAEAVKVDAPPPPPPLPTCVPNWGQCGGNDYTGPTNCCTENADPSDTQVYKCNDYGKWYSQCRPHA